MKSWMLLVAVAMVTAAVQWLGSNWLGDRQDMSLYQSERQDYIYDQLADIQKTLNLINDRAPVSISTDDGQSAVLDQKALRETIALVIKDELENFYLGSQTWVSTDNSIDIDSEVSDRAYNESETIVASAISAGQWQVSDTAAILPLVNQLTEDQRLKLLDKFHQAVGRGEIDERDGAPPL